MSYRHEEKYLISLRDYERFIRTIYPVTKKDTCACIEDLCAVRCIYFDKAAGQSYDPLADSAVVRLYMRDSLQGQIFLEIVKKTDGILRRDQLAVSHLDALKIISGDLLPLLDCGMDRAGQLYAFLIIDSYRPALLLDYTRSAYEFPQHHACITFKSYFRTGSDPLNFFQSDACEEPMLSEDKILMKVEYDHPLPTFLQTAIDSAKDKVRLDRGAGFPLCVL